MNIKSSNVTIMVRDMDIAISFYESIGLKLKQRWDNHYAMIEGGGITLGIHPGGDNNSGSGTVSIGFMIEDFEEVKELLVKNHIAHEVEDGKSGIYANFKDPDGTTLYFTKPKG